MTRTNSTTHPRWGLWQVPLFLALLLAVPETASAARGVPGSYPKLAAVVRQIDLYTPAEMETLSWYGYVICTVGPREIAEMRARNPNQLIFFKTMPQNIVSWHENQTWWYPDTLQSIIRLAQFYAQRNDWYLYDIHGERIPEWDGYAANWTPYCPVGTYGTSAGLTYAEWYARVAIPQIVYNAQGHPDHPWARWGWDSEAYQGILFEVMVDCPHCCVLDQYRYADPDRDGEIEGIEDWCWYGGDQDSLSQLMHIVNEQFYIDLTQALDDDFLIIMNRHGTDQMASWAWEWHGQKLEEWEPTHDPNFGHGSWWSWMYGRVSSWGRFFGDGYLFAEQRMHPLGIDEREGWDVTFIHAIDRDQNWSTAKRERIVRLGVGTSMLGDGYFTFTERNAKPWWFDPYEYDFGAPLEDFSKELVGSDTLYVRRFEEGFVEVNPFAYPLRGIPADDARFAFWLTIDDLAVAAVAADSVILRWTIPDGEVNQVDDSQVRFATFEITPGNWESATLPSQEKTTSVPGAMTYLTIRDLLPETTYYFAAKNTIFTRPEPGISNVVATTTGALPPPPDTTPPAAIDDLSLQSAGEEALTIAWSATGDDGLEGEADHYLARILAGEVIATEDAWDQATPITSGLPDPSAPGETDSLTITGLAPSSSYGLAVRIVDEVENVSALSNALLARTLDPPPPPPPPDSLAPEAISSLAGDSLYTDGFLLSWIAPGDDGDEGTAAGYILGYLADHAIVWDADWIVATKITTGLPSPEPAGTEQHYRLMGLAPDHTYGLSLRAYDDVENLSALGDSLLLTTLSDQPPPDTTAPAAVENLLASEDFVDGFVLGWNAPGDDDSVGTADHYILGYLQGEAITTEAQWDSATKVIEDLPAPVSAGGRQSYRVRDLAAETLYGLSLRAYDEMENESPLGPPLLAMTLPDESGPGGDPDSIAPAAIDDLHALEITPIAAALAWTCPGDDDTTGTAASFVLGWMLGTGLTSELSWLAAEKITTGLPLPDSAGTVVTYDFTPLLPETTYSVAVRAYDDAEFISPLNAPLTFQTPAWLDTIPPGRVADLAVDLPGDGRAHLTWTAAGDDSAAGLAALVEFGLLPGASIADEAEWALAEVTCAANTIPGGGTAEWILTDLTPGETWGVAVRYRDEVDLQGALSNSPTFLIPVEPVPDTTPPDSIGTLHVVEVGENWIDLAWTAVGDDGSSGWATEYVLGVLPARELTAADWEEAVLWAAGQSIPALPTPAEAGSAEGYRLTGLEPGESYGVSLRARDEAGNLSPFASPLYVEIPSPTEPQPPQAIEDLSVDAIGTTWIEFAWTAPALSDGPGSVEAYAIGYATTPLTAASWSTAHQVEEPPDPAPPGWPDSCRIAGLNEQVAYWIGVRSVDVLGNWSPLSNIVSATTLLIDRMPPEAPPAPRLVAGTDAGAIALSWSTVSAEDLDGYHLYGRPASAAQSQRISTAPIRGATYTLPRPEAEENYFVSVTAVDQSGNESDPSPETALFPEHFDFRGPFPHPIVMKEPAEFHIDLPPGEEGAQDVRIEIYTVVGDLVRGDWGVQLEDTYLPGSAIRLSWDGRNDAGRYVAPGLYFLKLMVGEQREVHKIYVQAP